MNESKQDIERRTRLHEFFKEDPQVWKDIVDELEISMNNEYIKLTSRECANRDWSAGWVTSHKFILDMERYFKKQWHNTVTMQGQQK